MGIHLRALTSECPGTTIIAKHYTLNSTNMPLKYINALYPPTRRIDFAWGSKITEYQLPLTEISITNRVGKTAVLWVGFQGPMFVFRGNFREHGGSLDVVMNRARDGPTGRGIELVFTLDGGLRVFAKSGFTWARSGDNLRMVDLSLPAFDEGGRWAVDGEGKERSCSLVDSQGSVTE